MPESGYAQSRSASSKQKKVPKTVKRKPKVTKKSKPGKVKTVSPKSATGRGKSNYSSVRPGFTKSKSAPSVKRVAPRTASGKGKFWKSNPATNSNSQSTGYSYNNKVVRPKSASSGYGFKNRAVGTKKSRSTGYNYRGGTVRGKSASSGYSYRGGNVRGRSASSGFNYQGGNVRGRSASSGFNYKGGTVRGRSASSGFNFKGSSSPTRSVSRGGFNYKGGKTSPRSASSGFNFRGGSPKQRTISRGYGYKSGLVRPRTATGQLRFKDKGVSPRYTQLKRQPDQTKVQVRTQKGRKKYKTSAVNPRSIKSNPRLHVGGAKKRYLSKPPATNASIFAGGVRKRGRSPKLIEQHGGRSPQKGNKKYRVVKVEPRSINSNPRFKRTANQTKLITYPKDLSAHYSGNIKANRKGLKQKSIGTGNVNYSGDIKQRKNSHRDVGTYYSGNIKHKRRPEAKQLGKRTYVKSKSQSQWASYYRSKTRKQGNFLGFQKEKYNKQKWMHPSVNHKLSRFAGTYKSKERVRKTNLWFSRKFKNDDQPKYLKGKDKKPGYDKDEIKIWNDYDNSREPAESGRGGKKKKKNEDGGN